MSAARRPTTEDKPLSPLDRTRLMVGVVMIPLAASAIFAAGVYSQRNVVERTDTGRNVVEVRAIYSDRRGAEVELLVQESDAEQHEASARLHSPGGPQAVLSGTPVISSPIPFSLTHPRHAARVFCSPVAVSPPLRGPPHVV